MDALYAALWTWWGTQSANAFYIGIGGRLRSDQARQDETRPYCVVTQIDGLPEYFQDGDYDELAHIELQFDIYSETNLEVLALSKKFMTLFDTVTFSVTGWTLLEFKRFRNVLMPLEDDADIDNPLYRYLLQYEVTLQKARA